jgi:hypothetical protein
MQYLSCAWFISFSLLSSRFIHIVTVAGLPSLIFTVYMCMYMYTYSLFLLFIKNISYFLEQGKILVFGMFN